MVDPVRRSPNQLAHRHMVYTYIRKYKYVIMFILFIYTYPFMLVAISILEARHQGRGVHVSACFRERERERESSWEISDFHHFEARTCSEHACNKVHFAVESSDMSQNLDVHDVHQHSLVSQSVSRMMYRYHVFLSTKVGAKDISMRPQWAS